MLFQKEKANDQVCTIYGASRWVDEKVTDFESSRKKKKNKIEGQKGFAMISFEAKTSKVVYVF